MSTRWSEFIQRWLKLGFTVILTAMALSAGHPFDRINAYAAPVAQAADNSAYQAYLPVVTHYYDSGYTNPFGVVMYGAVDQAHGLGQMQAAGAGRVTLILDWAAIEPVEGAYDWTSADTKIRNARDANMDVFVLFAGDPAWAWVTNGTTTFTDPQKRLRFVRTLIDRYDCDGGADAPDKLCVHDWSFYAEPDFYQPSAQSTPGAKGYWGRRPQEYAQMYADVATVAHQEDPAARVTIGGIAYDAFDNVINGGQFNATFLQQVLGELNTRYGGARRYIDAVAFHYYPLQFPSIRDKVLGRSDIKEPGIRQIMQAYGIGDLPLLVPEAGYWSCCGVDSDETKQAQRVVQLYVEALSVGVEHLSWFTVLDEGPERNTWGLFRGTDLNSPKPSYTAYQVLTRELDKARYLRPLNQSGVEGYVFRILPSIEKTVVWTKNTSGARATFNGSCLLVVDRTGAQRPPITDGSTADADRSVNGQVAVSLSPNEPLYVRACP